MRLDFTQSRDRTGMGESSDSLFILCFHLFSLVGLVGFTCRNLFLLVFTCRSAKKLTAPFEGAFFVSNFAGGRLANPVRRTDLFTKNKKEHERSFIERRPSCRHCKVAFALGNDGGFQDYGSEERDTVFCPD